MVKTTEVNKPKCICRRLFRDSAESPDMVLWLADKRGEMWECPECGRLLYRSKVASVQRWYQPENGGTFCLVQAKEMYCKLCDGYQIHVKAVGKPWVCLNCRVREGTQGINKEGK
jgi:predicted RNA-binding Zn-ribbon protein involved in translation (DUF1610 family)